MHFLNRLSELEYGGRGNLLKQGVAPRLTLMLAFVILVGGCPARSQERDQKEMRIKAVFLFRFTQFVEWPPDAFPDHSSPLIIGILGKDPFGHLLEQIVQNEKVQDREIVVRRVADAEKAKECHVVFIGESDRDGYVELLRQKETHYVLTVSDTEGFAEQGGAINFYVEKNKIGFEVNTESLKKAGLKASSKLLRLARIVSTSSLE